MDKFKEMLEIAKSLGLSGSEAMEFTNKRLQEIEEREQRYQDREEMRMKQEVEEKRIETERQIELKKLELEIERAKRDAVTNGESNATSQLKTKMPYFNEKIDNIESYLYKFQRHAEAAGWPKSSWANNLVTLLQGRALDYFREVPTAEMNDFDKVKQNLLKRFVYTEEAFREKFRSARLQKDEDFCAFSVRITSYYDRWLEMAEVEDDIGKCRDLMIRDQILATCHKDLMSFLKERKPKSIAEMTNLAEQYREAHPNKPMFKSTFSGDFASVAAQDKGNPQGNRYQQWSNEKWRNQSRSGTSYSNRNQTYSPKPDRDQTVPKRFYEKEGSNQNFKDKKKRVRCYRCNLEGHYARNCKTQVTNVAYDTSNDKTDAVKCQECTNDQELELVCGHKLPVLAAQHFGGDLEIHKGFVNRKGVTVLRDTGCTTIGVSKALVRDEDYTGESSHCILFTGAAVSLPIVRIFVNTPFLTGEVRACALEAPVADLIIGNVPGVSNPSSKDILQWYSENNVVLAGMVETRAKSNFKPVKQLKTNPINLDISRTELMKLQKDDGKLSSCFVKAENQNEVDKHKYADSRFYFENGLLFREYRAKEIMYQLVVPSVLVPMILKIAHDSPMSGHMGISRTKRRIVDKFYWPNIVKDIKLYCKTCDTCQRTIYKNRCSKAPIQHIPAIGTPFSRVSIDLIGPITPATDAGHRFILTLIDNATRWPEAVPLKNISAETVAEALFNIFTRLGIPDQILSDLGSQFTSNIMQELFQLFAIRHLKTSPYHAQTNGMVERLNGTLKQMLKRVALDRPKDWHRYLPACLFSYREATQEATGFSPFELLFGRTPRGPMDIVKDILSGNEHSTETVSVFEYIINLKERLAKACEMAKLASEEASAKARHFKNANAKVLREFKVGDQVLLLLPTDHNKLLMTWKGPFIVVKRTSKVDYIINIEGKQRLYHVNMLKMYHQRPEYLGNIRNPFSCASVGLIAEDQDDDQSESGVSDLQILPLKSTQSYKDVEINENLGASEKEQLQELLRSFQDVLSDMPGKTNQFEHKIELSSNNPVRLKPYPIPFKSKDIVETEVRSMLEQGIIEPSNSPFSSPIVLVKKKDGSVRFAIDFRKVNAITVFDATPIPNQEELMLKISGSCIFSKLDLTKGYWQIPMSEESKAITAFQTPLGLFQWRYMPFGLVNAPAMFAKMMRKLLEHIPQVVSFFDDILIHTSSFEQHIETLKLVFNALRDYGLTAKPSKLSIAFSEVEFLGHMITHGHIRPADEKIGRMLALSVPKNKKEV